MFDLIHSFINCFKVESISEKQVVIMAGWTHEEMELYLKKIYNQVDMMMVQDMVKVESILSFKEVKPDVSQDSMNNDIVTTEEFLDNNGLDEYLGNQMDEEDDFSDYEYQRKKTIKLKVKKSKRKKTKKSLSGTCEYCQKDFKHLRAHKFDMHLELLKEKENIQTLFPQECPFCDKLLKDRKAKLRHKCFKQSSKKVDYRKGDLKQEEKEHLKNMKSEADVLNDKEEFMCHLCGANCPSKSSLTNHLQMNCSNVCEICKEILPNKSEVKQHMFLVHKKVKTTFHNKDESDLAHECSECHKRYASNATLNAHVKKVHQNEITKVQCPDCGNLFSSPAALRKHATLHKPPELPCPICGKLFHNQTYLLRHANSVHADAEDKKFKCDVCGKGFTNKNALEGHHNWHFNLKPFQCR